MASEKESGLEGLALGAEINLKFTSEEKKEDEKSDGAYGTNLSYSDTSRKQEGGQIKGIVFVKLNADPNKNQTDFMKKREIFKQIKGNNRILDIESLKKRRIGYVSLDKVERVLLVGCVDRNLIDGNSRNYVGVQVYSAN